MNEYRYIIGQLGDIKFTEVSTTEDIGATVQSEDYITRSISYFLNYFIPLQKSLPKYFVFDLISFIPQWYRL